MIPQSVVLRKLQLAKRNSEEKAWQSHLTLPPAGATVLRPWILTLQPLRAFGIYGHDVVDADDATISVMM